MNTKGLNPNRLAKRLTVIVFFLFQSFQANSQSYLVSVGNEIYEVDPLSCTETFLCSIIVNTGGGTLSSTVNDIAYHPNGNLYALVANYFISINLGTCNSTTIATHTTGSNALVSAADGTLYAASDDLYTVDPITGVFTSLGTLPCSSGGDLAFESGDLYLTCDNGDLLKVDINNPANSTVVGNLGTGYWYGLWTVHTDCNDSYILVASQSDLYEVDINTAATTYSCSLGTSYIAGATMQGDFNASECGCGVDLGPDQDLCDGSVTLDATNSDYTYTWNDGSTNSTFIAASAGTYYVDIVDTTDGCTNSDTVVISGPMAPDAGGSDSVTVCSKDPALDLYTVLNGTADTGGVWSPSLSSGTGVFNPASDAAGTYTYSVTNACGTGTSYVDVSVIECDLGIPTDAITISVYPNPTSGQIGIQLSEVKYMNIFIRDLSGRIVYQNEFFDKEVNFELYHLASGSYFMSILNTNNQLLTTEKIQIVK